MKAYEEFFMQKKIIALAIAAALTAPAMAYAKATVYGQANLSIDMINDGAATNSTSANRLVSNNSRIGLKGSEDMDGGLSIVWQMESTVFKDTGVAPLFDRNTYIGVKSKDMGTVQLGRNDTPYKNATRRLDVFADSIAADSRGLAGVAMMGGGTGKHELRSANMITYISPAMSGFTVAAASVFGAETLPQPTAPNDKKGSIISLAGMYSMNNIYATLAYQAKKLGGVGTGTQGALAPATVGNENKALRLGGSYTMSAITVNAVFEKLTDTVAASGAETTGTNLYLAGKFSLSSTDAVKAAYTKIGETTASGVKRADDRSQVAIGYDHAMSKSTTVYALYTKLTNNGPVGPATTSADPSTVSFGMKYAF